MALFHWGNASLDPIGIVDPTLRSNGRGNIGGYANPALDRLLDRAQETQDRAERAAIYRAAERLVHDDAPWIFLWVPQDVYAASTRLRGWRPSPDERMNMHDAYLE